MEKAGKTVVVCFLILLTAGIGPGPAPAGNAKGARAVPVRVGYLPVLSQLPLVVSHENDRRNFSGIEASLFSYHSFTSIEAALRVGAVDIAAIPVTLALRMAGDGKKIRILGAFHRGGSRVVAREAGDLFSLKGKRIGVPGLDSSENLTLNSVMGRESLWSGIDFKVLEVPLKRATADLAGGKVDALYLPEPYGTMAEEKCGAVAVSGQAGSLTGGPLTVIAARAEILAKTEAGTCEWLRSIARSCAFIEKDIEASGARQVSIIQKAHMKLPGEVVRRALSSRTGGIRFGCTPPDPVEIGRYAKQALHMRLIQKPVPVEEIVNGEPMNRILKGGDAR